MGTDDLYRVGNGPHSVLGLHGWFGAAQAWQTLAPYLDGSRFSYYFLDYRGYGPRMGEQGDFTVQEAASDAVDTADQLGLDRYSVLGHSMGGSVMQQVLVQAPDRVRSLVGVSPVPAGGVPFDDDSWALFSGAAEEAGHRRAIIDLTTGNRLTGIWLDAAVRVSLATSDKSAFGAYLESWAKTDFHQQIEGNPIPVKVIVGEHDPALGEATMQGTFAKWYPNCELEVLANAGHYAFEETPIALATAIERFLQD